MKTAIVTTLFPQLSETFVMRHAEALEADIFCGRVDQALLEKLEYRGFVASAGAGQAMRPKVVRLMNRVLQQPVRNFQWRDAVDKRWAEFLDERKPDVVLAEFAPNAMSALPQCLQRGIPVVAHFHGFDASRMMRYGAYRGALKTLFRDAAAVVCVSHPMRSILVHEGCPPSKLHVVPCGAPTDEFVPSTTQVADQPCRFVAVARLTPGKGTLVLLRAFVEVLRQRPETRLTVVGSGPQEAEARAFLKEHKCEHAVTITGGLPNSEVRKLMASSSVFAQASLTAADGWVEGWGVSIAEALATGLPAVVTRSGGMTDLVIDGLNGFLFEEGDAQGMASHMVRLADDPALRVEMGKAGRAHIERVGSTAKQVQKLDAILQNVCHG